MILEFEFGRPKGWTPSCGGGSPWPSAPLEPGRRGGVGEGRFIVKRIVWRDLAPDDRCYARSADYEASDAVASALFEAVVMTPLAEDRDAAAEEAARRAAEAAEEEVARKVAEEELARKAAEKVERIDAEEEAARKDPKQFRIQI